MNEALGVSVWTSGSFKAAVTSIEAEGCQARTGMWLSLRGDPLLVQKQTLLSAGSGCAPAHTFHLYHQPQLSAATPASSKPITYLLPGLPPPLLASQLPLHTRPSLQGQPQPGPHTPLTIWIPACLLLLIHPTCQAPSQPQGLCTASPSAWNTLASLHLPFRSQPRLPP